MSGYGPPRGWRGSNAWSTASPQRTEEPMSETPDVQHEPMSDERLAEIKLFRLSGGYYDRIDDDLVREVERLRAELAARIAAESDDAAAGSYAGRAEAAEAQVRRLREANRTLAKEAIQAMNRATTAEAERDGWLDAFDAMRAEKDAETARAEQAEAALAEMRDLLGCISLYVKWRYVTKQLTTPQKDMWASAVDEWSARLNDGVENPVADRWWSDVDGRTALKRAADEQGDGEGGGA